VRREKKKKPLWKKEKSAGGKVCLGRGSVRCSGMSKNRLNVERLGWGQKRLAKHDNGPHGFSRVVTHEWNPRISVLGETVVPDGEIAQEFIMKIVFKRDSQG